MKVGVSGWAREGRGSEADEAAGRVGGGVGRRALLLRAQVGVQRVRVDGRQPGASLHEAVKIERDPIARCADLDARYFVAVRQRFVVVDLE